MHVRLNEVWIRFGVNLKLKKGLEKIIRRPFKKNSFFFFFFRKILIIKARKFRISQERKRRERK